MLKVLSNILCDLDPKVKVIGQKAGICDGVPSTSALVVIIFRNGQVLLDFSLTLKAATLIFISDGGSAISSAKEGKSGFIYNLVKS